MKHILVGSRLGDCAVGESAGADEYVLGASRRRVAKMAEVNARHLLAELIAVFVHNTVLRVFGGSIMAHFRD